MQAASNSFINESFLTLQSGQALCFVILKLLYSPYPLLPGGLSCVLRTRPGRYAVSIASAQAAHSLPAAYDSAFFCGNYERKVEFVNSGFQYIVVSSGAMHNFL